MASSAHNLAIEEGDRSQGGLCYVIGARCQRLLRCYLLPMCLGCFGTALVGSAVIS